MPRPGPNLRRIYTPYSAGIQPTWTVGQVRGALLAHELGSFATSAKLVDAMGRDDRLTACLETRIKGLLGSPFEVVASDLKSEVAVRMADEIGPQWYDILSEDELAEMLRWRVLLGFAICSLEWETTAAYWRPKVKVWNPQYCYHRQESDTWWMMTREAGEIQITPGDGKWMLIGRGRRPYMDGAGRSLSIPWLIRQFAVRDWARYSERHGMPLVKAMVPAAVDAPEKEEFFDDVRALSTETTVMLPTNVTGNGDGFDLQLLEATDKSWEGFERLITSCNVSMSISLLGQNLTTEVQGGSYAAAKVHDRVRADYLEADAEELSTTIRAQVFKPMVAFSYVEDVDALTPWPKWQTEPDEDQRIKAETFKITTEALGHLKTAGFAVSDVKQLGEHLGFDLVPVETPVPEPMVDSQQLASGSPAKSARGFVEGVLYSDAVTDSAARAGVKALAPDLKDLINIIESADDYPEMRSRLAEAYADIDPAEFAKVVEKALILSELAGRYAVLKDL